MTSIPPKFTTSVISTVGDPVGRNQTHWVRRRRIAIENSNVGTIVMLGIFGSFGSILGIIDTSRPGIIREIAKFCDFRHISGGRICWFWGNSELGPPVSEVLGA